MEKVDPRLRGALKHILLELAASSDHPSRQLQEVLRDVIQELHDDTCAVLAKRAAEEKPQHLKLVSSEG